MSTAMPPLMRPSVRRLRTPPGQRRRLLHPGSHLRFIEIILVDVDPACILARATGGNGPQRGASEEGHLDVAGEDVERHEPALALEAVERRVPLHRLAYSGRVSRDEGVDALPELALPTRHRGDVGLHRRVAVRFRDLRIST